MNKAHDYRALEREYITSQVSLREPCRKHRISAHSLVTVQAQKGKWKQKREAYQARESESFISCHAEQMADRQAEICHKALDTIDEALSKFREDMKATKLVRQPDGSVREEPAWFMKPRAVALLIDRLQVLFDRPARVGGGRDPSVRSELPIDALHQFVELTRGRAAPPTSPLPRTRRLDDGGLS